MDYIIISEIAANMRALDPLFSGIAFNKEDMFLVSPRINPFRSLLPLPDPSRIIRSFLTIVIISFFRQTARLLKMSLILIDFLSLEIVF